MSKEVPSSSRYKSVLSRIRKSAADYSFLWDNNSQDWKIELLDVEIDRAQKWEERYGLKKAANGSLLFYHNDKKISLDELAKELHNHAHHADIPPETLARSFVYAVQGSLMIYEAAQAKIREKVKERITKLEKELLAD
jgi:hypothetical protein